MTFTKTQKVYRIQQIGLTHPVQPRKTVQPRRQLGREGVIVFEIREFEPEEMQGMLDCGPKVGYCTEFHFIHFLPAGNK
jgi:hypothetical protein